MAYRYENTHWLGLKQHWREVPPPSGPAKGSYDWDHWTDGSSWELWRGTDYEVTTEEMRMIVQREAKARKSDVTIVAPRPECPDGLKFTFSLDRRGRARQAGISGGIWGPFTGS